MNFLCTVSPRFPENYQIGVRGGVWGVEEKFEDRIRRTSPGDLLVFSVGGHIRSLHRIESEVYIDHTDLWPPKDGSKFPLRVRISRPLAVGNLPLGTIADQVSFMKGKRWTGTIQGSNGVFNDRLTESDMELINSRMHEPPKVAAELRSIVRSSPRIPIQFFEEQIERAVGRLMDEIGCELVSALNVDQLKAAPDAHYTLLGHDRRSKEAVVVVLDGGAGNSSVLLHTLRNMSAVRGGPGSQKGVRGVILTGHVSIDLLLAAREIPNLAVREYKLSLELESEPDLDRNGSFGAA